MYAGDLYYFMDIENTLLLSLTKLKRIINNSCGRNMNVGIPN